MSIQRCTFIDPTSPEAPAVAAAARLLSQGRVIVYPTDTTYALGANALDPAACRLIFELKGRPADKPMHVVVSDLEMAEEYVVLNEPARILARKFLPGPLTLVLTKKEIVPDLLVAGRQTLGIRIPDNKICLMLAQQAGMPITATSANLSGQENIYSINELVEQFGSRLDQVDLIIDQGPLPQRPPSTLIDLTVSPPKILRAGTISGLELLAAIGA
ncbi:MAG: L-threonylcarbamoyladenylate synthase [Pyrinomonadaceae bacterium]